MKSSYKMVIEEGSKEEFRNLHVNLQEYATYAICTWGEVFPGFGAYSVQEVFFMLVSDE